MDDGDLQSLVDRFEQIERALLLASERELEPGSALSGAVADTANAALQVAGAITLRMSSDDLWNDLPILIDVWFRLDDTCGAVSRTRPDLVESAVEWSREFARALAELRRLTEEAGAAQVCLIAHPRDRVAGARLSVALHEAEACADRLLIRSLDAGSQTLFEAAMALLTAVAARAAGERRLRDRRFASRPPGGR